MADRFDVTLTARGSLGLVSTRRLLDSLHADGLALLRSVRLDLRDVTFAEPFALVALAAHLARVAERGAEIEFVCPEDFGCRRYLAASNVIQQVAEFGTVVGDRGLRRVSDSTHCYTSTSSPATGRRRSPSPCAARLTERSTAGRERC